MGILVEHQDATILLLNKNLLKLPHCVENVQIVQQLTSYTSAKLQVCDVDFLDLSTLKSTVAMLVQEAQQVKRTHLLVGGAYLEEQITILSLHALAEGLDVYILQDMIVARHLKYAQISMMRLCQAGIVPATLSQILYQWAALEPEEERRQKLQELSARQRQVK